MSVLKVWSTLMFERMGGDMCDFPETMPADGGEFHPHPSDWFEKTYFETTEIEATELVLTSYRPIASALVLTLTQC